MVSQKVKMVLHIDLFEFRVHGFRVAGIHCDIHKDVFPFSSYGTVAKTMLVRQDLFAFNVSWMCRFGRLRSDSHSQDTCVVIMCSAARRRYQSHIAPWIVGREVRVC